MTRYEYGMLPGGYTLLDTFVDKQPSRRLAEEAARDWVISPLRTGPRQAYLVRRAAGTREWVIVTRWSQS